MNRRLFLQLSSFSAAAGAARLVFSCPAFEIGPDGLRGEIAKARERGKPLLVLVIPRESDAKWDRGRALGAWINHADEEGMADLALVDVVCAGAEEVAGEFPEIDPVEEPWMFFVDTRGVLPMVQPIDPELPVLPKLGGFWGGVEGTNVDQTIRNRIAALEAAVREAVAGGDRLEFLGKQSSAKLSTTERVVIDSLLLARMDTELLDRGAARLRFAASKSKKSLAERRRVTTELAELAVQRHRQEPPGGAKWATSSGCGVSVEGEVGLGMMVACGMGFVPELSRRFLYFFTDR